MRCLRFLLVVWLGGCSSTVTAGGSGHAGSAGQAGASGVVGTGGDSASVGGNGAGGSGATCVAPYAVELRDALLLALPQSFVWQSYSVGAPNSSGWSGCWNQPCGNCTLTWTIETDGATATAQFAGECAVAGGYGRTNDPLHGYSCAIDLVTTSGSLQTNVTSAYNAANQHIDWAWTAPTITASWQTGPEQTCTTNFNLAEANTQISASLQEALASLALSYSCP